MSKTMPQIIMLNAAADTNKKRLDVRVKRNRDNGTASVEETVADMPMVNGRRLDQLSSDEYLKYLGS